MLKGEKLVSGEEGHSIGCALAGNIMLPAGHLTMNSVLIFFTVFS